MFNPPNLRRRSADEAEKPFWISYADLMTALMVLFLVVMLASLAALVQSVRSAAEINKKNEQQAKELQTLKAQSAEYEDVRNRVKEEIQKVVKAHNLKFRRGSIIDFGTRAQFAQGSDELSDSQQAAIRDLAPELIEKANSRDGLKVVERIIVEGFASPEGTYLGNLDLSARRSQRVMCALLDPPRSDSGEIRKLFATAGASSSSLKKNRVKSRRIEMRIEYYPELQRPVPRAAVTGPVGTCALESE